MGLPELESCGLVDNGNAVSGFIARSEFRD